MSGMTLRPYQVEAVEAARAELRAGKKRVLVTCPTGGGKTVLASDIIRSAVEKGRRVLFLAHRRELIHQTADKLRRFGVRYGVIMAGERMALQEACQVASIQTLARRDVLKSVDLIFFDEAHHAAAGTYLDVMQRWPNAAVVGLTATPWRLDGKGLGDVFDGHVLARTPRQLRDEGFLCPVGGWAYEAVDTSGAKVKGGDYVASSLAAAAMSKRVLGDVVEEYVRHTPGRRAVVFAASVEASRRMAELFVAAGVPAEHVDGTTPTPERDATLARLRAGHTLVVCNCNVLTEGFDCPELEVCILARPTLSTAMYLQMVGRVLRPAPGKESARIHDHAGCLAAHGHPYADRDYSPAPGTSVNAGRDDAKQPAAQLRCPACKSVRVRWPCDACGHSPTPEDLKLEFDRDVQRRAIEADELAAKRETEKRRKLRHNFAAMSHEERRAFFFRMVAKHGPRKAIGVYRWFSGETAWPDRAWREEAGAVPA